MDEPMITLPRAAVEALVSNLRPPYIHYEAGYCNYCYADAKTDGYFSDTTGHTSDCPVRIVQDALKKQP